MGSINWELGRESGITILGEVSLYSKEWVRSDAADSGKGHRGISNTHSALSEHDSRRFFLLQWGEAPVCLIVLW